MILSSRSSLVRENVGVASVLMAKWSTASTSRSYMNETYGGGSFENVPGFNSTAILTTSAQSGSYAGLNSIRQQNLSDIDGFVPSL